MFFRRYLTSLKSTYIFMVCFGLLMGVVFPLFSFLFFGTRAFTPLYAIGCLVAGFAVGTFCFYIIKQVLRLHLERQHDAILAFSTQGEDELSVSDGDELEAFMAYHDMIMGRILSMAGNVSTLIDHITPLHRTFTGKHLEMSRVSAIQATKEQETLRAVEEMNEFFTELLKEIEDLSFRTDQKASISTEMSATTDIIAENIRQYSTSVMETSASIEEMALSIKETASTIQDLAGSTEQTVGSIAQIGTAISNVRDNAQKTADCSERVRQQAKDGLWSMTTTLKAMREIEKANDESFECINRLSVHSARVGEFLNVIQDVVEQTNLLSLNASIIAAQAGDRGKAFAVVAEEVRSLAQRTSLSAKEIGDLVKNIQRETAAVQRTVTAGKARIKDGVKISGQTNEALVKIEIGAAEASEMVKKIAAATMEQAVDSRLISEEAEKNLQRVQLTTGATQLQEAGISHIVRTLEHMRFLSQQINSSTEEQARGNRLYLQSVLEDNDRVKKLRDTSLQQIKMGDVLLDYVRESGKFLEQNTLEAKEIMREVEEISTLTNQLQTETAPFKPKAAK